MIAIVGAMHEEILDLKQRMSAVTQEEDLAGRSVYRGRLSNQEIVLAEIGVGKVSSALGVTLIIEKYQPELIINIGVAGSLSKELNFGDVVVGDSLVYCDVDLTAFGYKPGQMSAMPETFRLKNQLKGKITALIDEQGEYKTQFGQILSCDSFVADAKQVRDIAANFPEGVAIEMESTAIAQVGYILKTPVLIIRAITDHADEEAKEMHENQLALAARSATDFVCRVLKAFI